MNLLTLLALSLSIATMEVTIKMTGFENDKGFALIRVRDESGKNISQEKVEVKNKVAILKLSNFKASKIAVEAFHDENNNGKIDKNLFGAPTESWGVTGTRPTFSAPKLEDILVPVSNGNTIEVVLK